MNKIKYSIYIIGGLLLSACHSATDNHAHEEDTHDHGTKTHTFLSDNYEVFVEYPQLIKDEAVSFKTYVTRLSDYKPMPGDSVRITLTGKTKGARKTEQATKQGIYTPILKPREGGSHTMLIEFFNNQKVESFEVKGITVYENHELAHPSIQDSETGNAIHYLKEQAWKTEFRVQKLKKRPFQEVIETSGQLLSANEDEVTIVAPFAGIVKMPSSLIEGKKVAKNEQLLRLTGKGLASDNISVHYNQLKTNYEKAKADYERLAKLVDEKIISEKAFLEAKTEYEQAKTAYENVAGTGDGHIKSTLDGFIKRVLVSEGEFVEAGTPLAVISQNQKLILRANVSQNHWHCLPEINEANFFTSYDNIVHNTKEHGGKLISYGRSASTSAWSTPIFFEINNIDNLIPGSYIEVFLLSKEIPGVIAIPISALTEEQGNFFVYVQLSGENYEKREIKTGISNGKEIEVTSGLTEGEIIVTKGAYQVKLASMSSALPAHGHSH